MKDKNLLRLLGVGVGAALLIAAFFLFAAPFVTATASIGSWSLTGNASAWECIFTDNPNGGLLTAWILSLVLMVLAFGVCVLIVLDKFGVLKLALLENKMILMLCAGVIAILGVVVGLLCFLTLPLLGIDSGAGLGVGAIFAAILSILGGCATGFGLVAPFVLK